MTHKITEQNFTDKIAKERDLVATINSEVDGQDIYYIVKFARLKFPAFKAACSVETSINLKDYGTILHTGLGEPSFIIKAILRKKYGMYNISSD